MKAFRLDRLPNWFKKLEILFYGYRESLIRWKMVEQIAPLRLSAPPLNIGEVDFNQQNCNLLS
jgi:hypothetical protein